MESATILDKGEGTLIGSALGDTIGLYTEFLTPQFALQHYPGQQFSLIDPVTPLLQDYHRARFEERAWTDDTDHTVLMILSYLRNGQLSEKDFASRLRSWCEQGLRCLDRLPLGLGQTVGRVVFDKEFLETPSETALSYWEKTDRHVAANGSLMRTSPVGIICLSKTEEETFAEAIRMSSITHADPRCSVSVAIVSGLIRALCKDEIQAAVDIDALIERAWTFTQQHHSGLPLDRDEFTKHAYAQTLDELVLCDRTMGYVYKCLGSSLWCLRQVFDRQETFKSAMTKLVMAAGDADTNGAVAGALMGALYGYKLLPAEWRDGMKYESWYREKIKALCIVSRLIDGEYDGERDSDTALDGGKGFLSEAELKKRETKLLEKILLADKARREEADRKAREAKKPAWKFW